MFFSEKQASEELKTQCQNTESSATDGEQFPRPLAEDFIDGIEVYEVSDGSEGSIEVSNTATVPVPIK